MKQAETKVSIGLLTAVGALLLISSYAVSAPCNECHTVHNSQDGQPMRFDNNLQPLPLLLKADCVFCHTNRIETASLSSPKVHATAPPTYIWGNTTGLANTTLAGGNFYWLTSTGQGSRGHNVSELVATGLAQPPGGAPVGAGTPQLQCAGENGCHGDTAVSTLPFRSLDGAHHTNATGAAIDGTTVGKSYRFLKGVLGWEDTNWEFTSNDTDHNRYVGEDRALVTDESASAISGFCAKCHDYFHNTNAPGGGNPGIANSGFASPWLRHPTDWDISNSSNIEYGAFNTYDTRVPVARTIGLLNNLPYSDVGSANQGIITCLTCHRAHGSPYYGSMRWNYRAWPGPDPLTGVPQNGCMICHTSKN